MKKTVTLEQETWKNITLMKIAMGLNTIDEVINKLILSYKDNRKENTVEKKIILKEPEEENLIPEIKNPFILKEEDKNVIKKKGSKTKKTKEEFKEDYEEEDNGLDEERDIDYE